MQSDEWRKELSAEDGLLPLEAPVVHIYTSDVERPAGYREFA